MTAVARMTVNNFPLLIGDLVTSNEEWEGDRAIHLLTVGPHTIVFPTGSGFTISGLRQKIAIVGTNLAIAWAGNQLAAKTIIKEMIEINDSRPFTLASLWSYFDTLPKVAINDEVSFLGWVKEGTRVQGFGFRSIEFANSKFGKVGLLGSGAADFRDYLDVPEIPRWETDHPWQSFSAGLLLSGFLLRVEMQNRSSLLQYYGAGYEIAGIEEDGFQKLDNVTFAFWEAQLNGKRVTFILQPRIQKYSYCGDAIDSTLVIDGPEVSSGRLIANNKIRRSAARLSGGWTRGT